MIKKYFSRFFFLAIYAFVFFNMLISCKLEQGEDVLPETPFAYQDSSLSNPKHEIYTEILRQAVRETGFPGASLLIYSPKDGLWNGTSGYARLESRTLLRKGHIMHAGDITSLYTGALVLRLAQEGILSPAEKITGPMEPAYSSKVTNADQISLEQLLNHSSGISDYTRIGNWIFDTANDHEQAYDSSAYLDFLDGRAADFAPGAGYAYSSSDMMLAALTAEGATKRDHAELLEEKILTPVGLTQTFYKRSPGYPAPDGVVNFYLDRYSDEKLENFTKLARQQYGQMFGHDGLFVSSHDLYFFMKALFADTLIVQGSYYQALFSPADSSAEISHAAGPEILKTAFGPAAGHRSDTFVSSGFAYYFPERGVHIIFLTNAGSRTSEKFAKALPVLREQIFEAVFN